MVLDGIGWHRIASHRIASHRIASHRIASRWYLHESLVDLCDLLLLFLRLLRQHLELSDVPFWVVHLLVVSELRCHGNQRHSTAHAHTPDNYTSAIGTEKRRIWSNTPDDGTSSCVPRRRGDIFGESNEITRRFVGTLEDLRGFGRIAFYFPWKGSWVAPGQGSPGLIWCPGLF